MPDDGIDPTYVLGARLCPWEGWIPPLDRDLGSTDFSLPSSLLMAPLDNLEDLRHQTTHIITSIMKMSIATQGTMILIRSFPPFSLLPVFALEDEVDGREEEVAEDVADRKPFVDDVGN